ATLLWRRVLRKQGSGPSLREFTVLGLLTVPAGLAVAVLALWAALHVLGGLIIMTGNETGSGHAVIVWVTEGTWRASVDAAQRLVPPGTSVTLLHVTPAELPDAAHSAYAGLFGRTQHGRNPGARVAELAAASAGDLLDAAARRLGRPCDQAERRGMPEREVVAAAAGAALLIMARDGDQSRLGPKSLGKAARFVVDHAPCPVLLVWPEAAPAITTMPPPPPERPGPHGPGPHSRP
ncbi:MAG: universal stress protein, partial [Trebonia sp.]